jgi:hypothetical protein
VNADVVDGLAPSPMKKAVEVDVPQLGTRRASDLFVQCSTVGAAVWKS